MYDFINIMNAVHKEILVEMGEMDAVLFAAKYLPNLVSLFQVMLANLRLVSKLLNAVGITRIFDRL